MGGIHVLKLIYNDTLLMLFLTVVAIDVIIYGIWFLVILLLIQVTNIFLKLSNSNFAFNIENKLLKLIDKLYFDVRIKYFKKFNFIGSILLTILTCLISIRFVYSTIHFIIFIISLKYNLDKDVNSYISLTLVLIGISYFPDKIVLFLQIVTNKFVNKFSVPLSKEIAKQSKEELILYKKLIICLRPKLWMYFISIGFTVLNSLEKISKVQILNYSLWLQIKPVVIEAVFTMLVVDRFVNIFKNERNKIKEEVKEITNTNKQSEIV